MKKLLIGLLLIVSVSVHGFELNETSLIDYEKLNENSKLIVCSIGAIGLTFWFDGMFDPLEYNTPKTFYRANNTRGLFDGLDRETHFAGGFGLYYWMRHKGHSKAKSLFRTTLYSLAWELKDGLKFMNYDSPWFHRTSVGNLLIHFTGDGFDIKDHYCVMLGIGTAIIFEYSNELLRKHFPKIELSLNLNNIELRF